MKKEISIIGCWINLSRAYEIAKLGGFKIKIVFDKEYINGFNDYELIKAFYGPENFSSEGEIIVEITPPEYSTISPKRKGQFETLEDIRKRIEQGRTHLKSFEFASESCESLLKSASNRLNFSLNDIEMCKQIAAVIAQLDNGGDILVEHIAEAIQYRAYCGHLEHCIAENKTVQFGHGINIALSELDNIDIQSAIDYLTNLIGVPEIQIS